MTLNEFYKRIEKEPYDDYIVCIKSKYSHEEKYHYHNEIYVCDADGPCYFWLNDWQEGEEEVYVIGYIALQDISVKEKEK